MKRLTKKIHAALVKASVLHRMQNRKWDWVPYIVHPFSVAWILTFYIDDEDIIVAGLLHDTLEDAKDYQFDDLEEEFWSQVAQYVKEVSEEQNESWKTRKQNYLKALETASFGWMMICCADKIHNLNSFYIEYQKHWDDLWTHFNSSKEEMIWFYSESYRILKAKLDNEIIIELEKSLSRLMNLI